MSSTMEAGSPPSEQLCPVQAKPRGGQDSRGEEGVRPEARGGSQPTDQTPSAVEARAEASCVVQAGARRVRVERPRSRLAKAFQIQHHCQRAMPVWTMREGSEGSTRG